MILVKMRSAITENANKEWQRMLNCTKDEGWKTRENQVYSKNLNNHIH